MTGRDWRSKVAAARQTWLVTGAAGFIGSHLVNELLALGQVVVGLDDFSTGYRRNLDAVQRAVGDVAWQRFLLVEADIRDLRSCADAMRDVDYVLHQAAIGSVPRSMADPLTTHSVNVDGSFNVFLAAIQSEVEKVVYASSSSVYGDDPTLPKIENSTGQPLSPYGATKQVVELYANTLHRTHQLPVVGLRYFNVVGARQDPEGPYAGVVPRWIAAIRDGDRPVVYGDGETSRDFCPVGNVVQANLLAALSGEETNGELYNIALGRRTTLNDLLVALSVAVDSERGGGGRKAEPLYEDSRPGDIRHSFADISKARAKLDYAPGVSLTEGLELAAAL